MAKASKKPDTGGQGGSRKGAPRAAARKPAPRRQPPVESPAAVEVVEVVTADPVAVEALLDRPPASPPAEARAAEAAAVALGDALVVLQDLQEQLRIARAEAAELLAALKAGASGFEEHAREAQTLRDHLRAGRSEVAELLAAVKSEATAAAGEIAELRHQCRQTGDRFVAELGEESLALGRLRQVRDEAAEVTRGIDEPRGDLRALRTACAEVAAELADLAEQNRTAFRAALADALDGARRLREEIDAARADAAEETVTDEPLRANETTAPATSRADDRRSRFGVTVAPALVVAEVHADGPAAAAGLVRGDVIEELNGRAVHSGGDLRDAAAAVPAGEDITLQLRHGGEPLVLTLHPADGNGEVKSRLGVTVERGLVVTEVSPDSPAEAAGLVRGDVIEDAHGHPVHTGDQLHAIIHAQPAGAEVMLVVTRNGERLELMAHLDGE